MTNIAVQVEREVQQRTSKPKPRLSKAIADNMPNTDTVPAVTTARSYTMTKVNEVAPDKGHLGLVLLEVTRHPARKAQVCVVRVLVVSLIGRLVVFI